MDNDFTNPKNGDDFGANPRAKSRGGRNVSPADPDTGESLPVRTPTRPPSIEDDQEGDDWTCTRNGEGFGD